MRLLIMVIYVSMNRYLLVNNTPIHNNDYLGLGEITVNQCMCRNIFTKHEIDTAILSAIILTKR